MYACVLTCFIKRILIDWLIDHHHRLLKVIARGWTKLYKVNREKQTQKSRERNVLKIARSRFPAESCWPINGERKVPETPKIGRKVAHTTGNNAIIDYPCVSQFYLLKLVTGNHWNQTATGMKFAVRVNGRMRSIEFCIKIIVGKN